MTFVMAPVWSKIRNTCRHSVCSTGLRTGRCGCPRWVELLVAGLAVVAVKAMALIWNLAWINFVTIRGCARQHCTTALMTSA